VTTKLNSVSDCDKGDWNTWKRTV